MIYTDDKLTPIPNYPVYPPYHVGDYLEDHFRKKLITDNPALSRDYIGISWTTLYCSGPRNIIQPYLDSLPIDGKYFTVSQHDDAPSDILPPDTICFSAGGNVKGKNIIPIPLICSKLNLVNFTDTHTRNTLASFVGSLTHPIRQKLINFNEKSKNIQLYVKGWSPTVTQDEFKLFITYALNSKFCLCPRGYGLNSFRLYEAMQLGCIPVIITDEFYLPWEDEINWNDISVLIPENEMHNMESILLSYSESRISEMKTNIKLIYDKYFTMNGMYQNIIKTLNRKH